MRLRSSAAGVLHTAPERYRLHKCFKFDSANFKKLVSTPSTLKNVNRIPEWCSVGGITITFFVEIIEKNRVAKQLDRIVCNDASFNTSAFGLAWTTTLGAA